MMLTEKAKRVLALSVVVGAALSLTSCKSIVEALNETASGLNDAASEINSAISDISIDDLERRESETAFKETVQPSFTEEMPLSEETYTEDLPSLSENIQAAAGIRPEFKETMDSYEAFFKEYVDFLKKYESSENTLGMLSDYMDYISKYSEMSEKLDSLYTDAISEEETAYYIEVTMRITELLGELY